MTETILTNAVLVLRDRLAHGTIVIRDDVIAEISDIPLARRLRHRS